MIKGLRSNAWIFWIELAVCLCIGALLSVRAGQDANWDLRNYHLYNAYSVLDHRQAIDFFPADKHTALNPLLDFFYAYCARGPLSAYPRLLAAAMGFWYGGLACVTLQLARLVLKPKTRLERFGLVPLIVLTSLSGAMTFSQIGTTSNDIAVALFTVSGVLLLLQACELPFSSLRLGLGALMIGVAAGAKLTALVFAPAGLTALVLSLPRVQRLGAASLFCLAWGVGFTASFGWWGIRMWQRFGNPFFPMLNQIFRSPLAPPLNLTDLRFFPRSFLQWIGYPFYWAFDRTNHLVFETDFRDPRLALAMTTLVAMVIVLVHQRQHKQEADLRDQSSLAPPQLFVILFASVSYVGWLCTSSILRYAITLEVLAPIVVAVVIYRTVAKPLHRYVLISACSIACLVITDVPQWGHTSFAEKVVNVDMSWTQPHTLFLGVYEPIAYLAGFVPLDRQAQFAGLGFVNYTQGYPLGAQGEELIRAHQGPIVALFREERRPFLQLLASVGLSPDVKNCRRVISNVVAADSPQILACDVLRAN